MASTELSPDDVGREKLRRYRHVSFIGKGAFAEVFKHVSS